jgi:hypothetical protein
VGTPGDKNDGAIQPLERLLEELRANPSTAWETEAIREIGYEIDRDSRGRRDAH